MTKATYDAQAVRSAGLAELVWLAGGPPQALGVVPLLLGDSPAVALTWAHAGTAHEIARSAEVALVLSEPRLAGPAWAPQVLRGRATLVEDGDGELFVERLLEQELRKHPPARSLADSTVLRREHWWYLPRLVLLLEPDHVEPVPARRGPGDAVLAVEDDGLHVAVVEVRDWSREPLALSAASEGVRGPAALVGQEVSVPDAERWTVHRTTGHLADGRFSVDVPAPDRGLEPVPGLLARVRRQRTLERACVRALRDAGHA